MNYIQKEQSYFFTSNSKFLRIPPTLNGSRFTVNLQAPIMVPSNAEGTTISCTEFALTHVNPNVSGSFPNEQANNKIMFIFNDGYNPSENIDITLDDGNYTPDSLNLEVQTKLSQVVIPWSDPPTFFSPTSIIITANPGSQRIILSLAKELTLVTNTAPNVVNVMPLLGWPHTHPNLSPSFPGQIFVAPQVALLNRVNVYLLHAPSLLQSSGGIPVNAIPQTILATAQVNVPAGNLLTVEPINPTQIPADHLKYNSGNDYTFYLTDEQLRPINTLGEVFSFKVVVKYMVPARTL